MSGFVSKADDPSYEDRAGALLAQVADLLLPGNEDWKALERLEAALEPPKKPAYEYFKKSIPPTDRSVTLNEYGSYTMGGGVASSSSAMRAVEIAYEDKLRDMLSSQMKTDVFKRLYSGEPVWGDPPTGPSVRDHSHSVNPAAYEHVYKAMAPDPKITKELIEKYLKDLRRDGDIGDKP
jgi:hypothetical protein